MSKKFSVPAAAKTPLILYGRHAVTAALANPERKIAKLLCTAENAPEAKKICAARGLPEAAVNIVDRREIDRILPRDAVHQGFALYCSELPEYSLEDICILAADKPVLGICRGIQVMNAVLGGDLYQDIKPFEHLPHNGHWAKVHTVTVRRGTLLSRILGQDTVLVNSQHHQAVDRVAPGFTLAALSEDGIVEAIEKPDARFCLGVQWHPEWLSDADPAMQGLFDAFVNACSK